MKDLPFDTEEKKPGIKFHSSMKFDSHISTVVNKVNQLIGLTKRSFSFITASLTFLRHFSVMVLTQPIGCLKCGTDLCRGPRDSSSDCVGKMAATTNRVRTERGRGRCVCGGGGYVV